MSGGQEHDNEPEGRERIFRPDHRWEKRDVRLANGAVHTGDTVILEEWDPDTQTYTGRKVETVVTAVRTVPAATD